MRRWLPRRFAVRFPNDIVFDCDGYYLSGLELISQLETLPPSPPVYINFCVTNNALPTSPESFASNACLFSATSHPYRLARGDSISAGELEVVVTK